MKKSSELEIPLITTHKAFKDDRDPTNSSHFREVFSSEASPSKFIVKPPIFKFITFLDVLPYIRKINSSRESIESKDLRLPDKHYNIEAKALALDYQWTAESKKPNPSFAKALLRAFKPEIFVSLGFAFVDLTLRIIFALFIGNITNIVTDSNLDQGVQQDELIRSAITLAVLVLVASMAGHWQFFMTFVSGGKVRLTVTSLLYKKLNSISLTSLHEFQIGKVINLIANDLNDVDYGAIFMPSVVLCPYILLLAVAIMWKYFGPACLIGLLSSILFLMAQIYISNQTGEPRKENKQLTDERVKFTNEIIENIRLIKMYAWTKPFHENVKRLREKEYKTFMRILLIDVLGRNLSVISSYFSILLICITYISLDGVLSPEKVYACMIILGVLSLSGLMFFHIGRMFLVNFRVTLQRVQGVMSIPDVVTSEEISQMRENSPLGQSDTRKGLIVYKRFTAYWNKEDIRPCLSSITLTISPGTLTTVIGKIGSGKTTLLFSLLKELPMSSGTLTFSGKVAYVEQEPIIFSGTVRDNITFGKDYNESLYREVIRVCNLESDLTMFSHGDLTLIGERGVTLSGGQKARISLARAVYSESDIYLLDDPFSAVDSKVAKDMFKNGLRGGLMKNKTIVLVTHHIHFAKESDYIVVLDGGKIQAQGTYAEIERKNVDLLNIFNSIDARKSSIASDTPMSIEKEKETTEIVDHVREKDVQETATTISFKTYKDYIRVIGTRRELILLVIPFLIFQLLVIYYTRFIGAWAMEHNRSRHENPNAQFDHTYYITTCFILLVLIYAFSFIKRIRFNMFILKTNTEMHSRMMDSLIKAKVLFFDLNPVGRILNRFANDVGVLDKTNVISSYDLIDGLLNSSSLLITVCFINPPLLIASAILAYFLYLVQLFFKKPMIEVKKLELASKSPIFSTVSSTLTGLIIIRVYHRGGKFIREFLDLIYNNSKAHFFYMKANRLFGMTLDAGLKGIVISGVILFAMLAYNYGLESAAVGMSLYFIIQVGEETNYVLRQFIVVDMNMQSAQRMMEYCHLESEAPEKVPKTDALVESQFQGKWPTRGEITFNNVSLRYRPELPCAVNGLSFTVAGGTKVACVGRTGAGKSSIIQALFRMVEIDESSSSGDESPGYIKIDGVDIGTIGLSLLRQRLSIIPQTPVVFTGTIRRNLDPFEQYTDEQIWNALVEVSLRDRVRALENQLETDMTMSASVFSAGQKQLICLARAILMKSRILILDEATASVDIETDDFIQRKIMEKFTNCTVVTIAHRLITIANYDKVVVMDKGRLVEYDTPYRLLVEREGDDKMTRQDGIFVDMVRNTGKSMARKIFKVAREHYYSTNTD